MVEGSGTPNNLLAKASVGTTERNPPARVKLSSEHKSITTAKGQHLPDREQQKQEHRGTSPPSETCSFKSSLARQPKA